MTRVIAWNWLLPEDEQRFAVLPSPRPAVDVVHPGTIASELLRVGGETPAVVLFIGWTPLVLDLLEADVHLRRRTVVWAMHEEDLARAHDQADRLSQILPRLLVATYATVGDLPRIVSRLPLLGWSAAVFSDDPALHAQIPQLRNWSLSVGSTMPSRTLVECQNFLARETRLEDALALTVWRGGWAGRSALCLAGGPGLDRDLPFVRRWMDRCVVIAADVVATRLERLGIKIDFIVNADAHADVATRVECPGDPATVLIMPLTGHPELDLRCPRRSYEGADPVAGHVLGRDHAYTHGTNVGSCTVGFAEYLGCSESVLVGHDLSFAAGDYYSTCVADQTALQRSSLTHAASLSQVMVPGNGGGDVRSTHAFVHGISDLGGFGASFVRRGGRMLNCNCNTATGAVIPFTSAVPADWQPAGSGPAPRPGAGTTLAAAWPTAPARLQSLVVPACVDFARAMRSLPEAPAAFLRGALDLGHGEEPNLGQTLLAPFCRPALLQLACLLRHELAAGGTLLAKAMRQDVLVALDHGSDLVQQTLAGAWTPASLQSTPADAVAAELATRAPVLPQDDLAATLLPLILRDLRDACGIDPAFPTPRAIGVVDGVHLLSALVGTAPRARLEELLGLARLLPAEDPLRYVEEIAVRHGVCVDEGSLVAQAVAALLALRGDNADVDACSRCAMAWPQAVPLLIKALAGGGSERQHRLARLVADHGVEPDDPMTACLIQAGIAAPTGLTGPYSVLAAGERQASAGNWAESERSLADLPVWHAVGTPAAILRCRCAFHIGGEEALMSVINSLPEQGLRVAALHGFFAAEEGPVQAVVQLAELGIAPVPAALLTASLRSCLAATGDRSTRQTVCQLHLVLLRATLSAEPPPAELAELAETQALAERALAILNG